MRGRFHLERINHLSMRIPHERNRPRKPHTLVMFSQAVKKLNIFRLPYKEDFTLKIHDPEEKEKLLKS